MTTIPAPMAVLIRKLHGDCPIEDIRPLMNQLDQIERQALAEVLVEDAAEFGGELNAAQRHFVWLAKAEPIALAGLGLFEDPDRPAPESVACQSCGVEVLVTQPGQSWRCRRCVTEAVGT